MGKTTKIWLVIAASLILIGCMTFGGVMTVLKWDFAKLSTIKYETNDYEIDENYKNISIVANTADVVFELSENGKTSVVCYEENTMKHSVSVKGDTLVIDAVDTRKWYEYIGIGFGAPKITVYLPQGEYGALKIKDSTGKVEIPKELSFESIDISTSTGDVNSLASASGGVKIKTSTGDIFVENISVGALDLSVTTGRITASGITCEGDVSINVSTGKAYLSDVACKNITSEGNTGDISLENVIATEKLSIKRSTGDVKFDACDAVEIFVETDTGNVVGSLLTEKIFITKTDTGRINIPNSVVGGKCEITTDTGDIKIEIK